MASLSGDAIEELPCAHDACALSQWIMGLWIQRYHVLTHLDPCALGLRSLDHWPMASALCLAWWVPLISKYALHKAAGFSSSLSRGKYHFDFFCLWYR